MILLLVGNILSQHTVWNRIFFCRLSSITKARVKKIHSLDWKIIYTEALFPLVHDTHISLTKTKRPKDNFGNSQLHLPWFPNCPWTLLHLVQRAIVDVARRLMKYDQRNQALLDNIFQVVLQVNSIWIRPFLESINEYFSLTLLLFTTSDKLMSAYPRDSVCTYQVNSNIRHKALIVVDKMSWH